MLLFLFTIIILIGDIMQFYQYWLVVIVFLLVFVSLFNIIKMFVFISRNKYPKIDNNDMLNSNIRNLFLSVGLLSVCSLVYIMLVFFNN